MKFKIEKTGKLNVQKLVFESKLTADAKLFLVWLSDQEQNSLHDLMELQSNFRGNLFACVVDLQLKGYITLSGETVSVDCDYFEGKEIVDKVRSTYQSLGYDDVVKLPNGNFEPIKHSFIPEPKSVTQQIKDLLLNQKNLSVQDICDYLETPAHNVYNARADLKKKGLL